MVLPGLGRGKTHQVAYVLQVTIASTHEAKSPKVGARTIVSTAKVGLAPWTPKAVDAVPSARHRDIEHPSLLFKLDWRFRDKEWHDALLDLQDHDDVELEALRTVNG